MNWRDRLAKLVAGDQGVVTYDAIPALQQARAAFVVRARMLRRHAEQAPNQLQHDELSRLAGQDETRVHEVTEVLTTLGGQPAEPPPLPAVTGALNHWARLVEALESHRAAVKSLREQSIHFAEALPDTAALFDRLCREEERHGIHLRDLIARTDPQALD
ncbi:MAG TPA: ferritin-like domain-containing protein [Candidatus Binatia bacterium]|nr:ferritin-like domain-containing protein [Candidatus Binatia bacterium]